MANIEHGTLGYAEAHVPHFAEYANATAREGATGLTSADDYKIALQTDDHSHWVLTDYSGPTWVGLGTPPADSVTGAKIADDAVDSEHYTDASIDEAHLASGVGIPSGTIMLFGQNSAPTGWTRKADWQDNAMLCYAASGNIGNGGAVNPQSTHTHTGPDHTHDEGTLQFKVAYAHTASGYRQLTMYQADGTARVPIKNTKTAGGGADTATVQITGEYYYTKDGTGDTGSGGTGATGANSAPHYQEVIAATKD